MRAAFLITDIRDAAHAKIFTKSNRILFYILFSGPSTGR